jgi:hypothetical protein
MTTKTASKQDYIKELKEHLMRLESASDDSLYILVKFVRTLTVMKKLGVKNLRATYVLNGLKESLKIDIG